MRVTSNRTYLAYILDKKSSERGPFIVRRRNTSPFLSRQQLAVSGSGLGVSS